MKYKGIDGKTIICEDCGKEFKGVYRRDIPTKCPECREYKPVGTKTIVCKDCGEEFEGKRSIRCEECKLKERRRVSRECNNKRRHNIV